MDEKLKSNDIAKNTKHGGAGALKRITQGKPFIGLARIAEEDVKDRLEVHGIEGELQRNAERFQVVSDLYYAALTKAFQDGDPEQITAYMAKWGWIHGKTCSAWDTAAKHRKKVDKTGEAIEILATYRKDSISPQEGKNEPN